MQYRTIKKLDLSLSTFGIGCMRLPLQQQPDGLKDSSKIDQDEAVRMIRHGIDEGVNYIDTAYPYHGGNSERVVAEALKDGYREKVYLATKLPVWLAKSYDDFDRLLNEQLEKLQTDHIDFYLLHALNAERWEFLKKVNVFKFLDQAKKDGRIRHAGFSFHDQLPLFKEIIDSYSWDMTQIQLNLLDDHYQAGLEGLHYAADRDVMVVIMEPLRGGALAARIPNDVRDVWNQAETKRTPVEWAFRWLADFKEVSVILSGVSTMEQLQDNLRIFTDAAPGCMNEQEKDLVSQVQALYRSKIRVNCTRCNYCMPCPSGVNIPEVFRLYNNMFLFDDPESSRSQYQKLIKDQSDATQCVECGLCEAACPQSIPIINKLVEAHQALTT